MCKECGGAACVRGPSFRLRPPAFALRATADKSGYGGQVETPRRSLGEGGLLRMTRSVWLDSVPARKKRLVMVRSAAAGRASRTMGKERGGAACVRGPSFETR